MTNRVISTHKYIKPRDLIISRRFWIIGCVIIFLTYFITRSIHLLAMPLFIDEGIHLTRAQFVWQGYPLDLLLSGKAGPLYIIALIDPFHAPVWLGRYIIVLCGSVGLASVMGVSYLLGSRITGLLAGCFWVFCPYLFFFEREILVDAPLAAFATFCAWTTIRMIRTGRTIDAILCGLALVLCAFDKTTGLVFLDLPVFAFVLPGLINRQIYRLRIRQISIAYITALLVMAVPVWYLVHQQDLITGISALTTEVHTSVLERLSINSVLAVDAFTHYFNPILLVLMIGFATLAILTKPRYTLIGIALSVIPLGVLITIGYFISLRYMVIAVPGLIILSALGYESFVNQMFRQRAIRHKNIKLLQWLTLILVAFVIIVSLPFINTDYWDTANLPLALHDKGDYITFWTGGYGLNNVASDLIVRAQTLGHPLTVIGMIGNCYSLRLYIPVGTPVTVKCPDIWDLTSEGVTVTQGIKQSEDEIARIHQLEGGVLVLVERNGLIPITDRVLLQPYKLIKSYYRPGGEYTIDLYMVGVN